MALLLDAISLPVDLLWVDEYAYTPVKQTINTAVDGSLVIEAAAALTGRPITLQGGDDYAWISKATLESLRLKQATPGLVMTLSLLGVTHSVIFIQPGITAKQVVDYSNPASGDWYSVTLKFIKIS
jgi:hypothetical protein